MIKMLSPDQILLIVKEHCSNGEPVLDNTSTPAALKISVRDLKNVCYTLRDHPSTYFDMLSCITGVDNGVEAGTMEVVYNLYSIPFNHHTVLKVTLPRAEAVVDSVIEIWKTANWHERELFDMFGIKVTGHPDLRRILMPADWEGYPLRKDYQQAEYYRDIKIEY
jgi:NADH-quinone oxidoreductase subunit C